MLKYNEIFALGKTFVCAAFAIIPSFATAQGFPSSDTLLLREAIAWLSFPSAQIVEENYDLDGFSFSVLVPEGTISGQYDRGEFLDTNPVVLISRGANCQGLTGADVFACNVNTDFYIDLRQISYISTDFDANFQKKSITFQCGEQNCIQFFDYSQRVFPNMVFRPVESTESIFSPQSNTTLSSLTVGFRPSHEMDTVASYWEEVLRRIH